MSTTSEPDDDPDDASGPEIPEDPEARAALVVRLTEAGRGHHQSGGLMEAEAHYRWALKIDPEYPDALNLLGLLALQGGQMADAVALISRAAALAPQVPDYQANLGNMRKIQGRLDEAEAAYRRALELKPDFLGALLNLGVVLKDRGRVEEALAVYRRCIELQPGNAGVQYNLGNLLQRLGRTDEAAAAYRSVLALDPSFSQAHMRGYLIAYNSGDVAEASRLLRDWLRWDPDNVQAQHLLTAHTGEDIPDRASDAYVRESFDQFAQSFDRHLELLEYRAPELALTAIRPWLEAAPRPLDILDAGCGTGLCAPLLKPFARRLVGVDLSEGMLRQAAARRLYDQLLAAELTAYLEAAEPGAWDLVISTDVLVYFGVLGPVLNAAARALRPGGRLVFTVERLDGTTEDGAGFRLLPAGRYAHTAAYVRDVLEAAGLEVLALDPVVLRQEVAKPVGGLVALAGKPGALTAA